MTILKNLKKLENRQILKNGQKFGKMLKRKIWRKNECGSVLHDSRLFIATHTLEVLVIIRDSYLFWYFALLTNFVKLVFCVFCSVVGAVLFHKQRYLRKLRKINQILPKNAKHGVIANCFIWEQCMVTWTSLCGLIQNKVVI